VLLNGCATGIRNAQREFGQIIRVRCINSVGARQATVRKLLWQGCIGWRVGSPVSPVSTSVCTTWRPSRRLWSSTF